MRPDPRLQRTRAALWRQSLDGESVSPGGSRCAPPSGQRLGIRRGLVGGFVLGSALLAGSGCHSGPSFDQYRKRLSERAGPDAVDCGLVRLGSDRSQAVKCAASGLENRQAVHVIFQVQGIDSSIFHGLAVTADGKGTWLMWDDDTYGHGRPLHAQSWIDEKPCIDPSVVDNGIPIRCSSGSAG
jgi:hypothetical protein